MALIQKSSVALAILESLGLSVKALHRTKVSSKVVPNRLALLGGKAREPERDSCVQPLPASKLIEPLSEIVVSLDEHHRMVGGTQRNPGLCPVGHKDVSRHYAAGTEIAPGRAKEEFYAIVGQLGLKT